jgi:hypothetical protein
MTRTFAWLGLLLAGCTTLVAPPAPWTAPELSGRAGADKLSAPISVRLRDGGVAQLTSCDDLNRRDAQISEEASGTNVGAKSFQSQRVGCQSLDALKTLRPATRSQLPAVASGDAFAAVLEAIAPARFFLAISDDAEAEVRKADAEGKTLKQFSPDTRFRAGNGLSARIDDDGARQDVKLLARGDFDGDGLDDWLLRIDSSLEQGSYGDSRLWLVTRSRDSGPLRVLKRWP